MKHIVVMLLVFVSYCSSENKPDIEINLNVNIESQTPLVSDNPSSDKEKSLTEGSHSYYKMMIVINRRLLFYRIKIF